MTQISLKMQKVIVTCPPMIGLFDEFVDYGNYLNLDLYSAEVNQTLSEEELINIIPEFDGWIVRDDPASKTVLRAGKDGNLKSIVKWGIGIDNIDQEACSNFDLDFANTPGMFGSEVADIALSYLISLARCTYFIDREVREGKWPKPIGISLRDKNVALVGYGDIGRQTAKRLIACEMNVIVYDPFAKVTPQKNLEFSKWPKRLNECDFIIINCSLNESTFNLIKEEIFKHLKFGVKIINVARGSIINENDLIKALDTGLVESVALDVFETEPLPSYSKLRSFKKCIFGSHNSSNTREAVLKTSFKSLDIISNFLMKRNKQKANISGNKIS